MKYSIQFSDTIHILAYIEIFKDTTYLSSEMIASSVETNAANVRKIMSHLKKANLIVTQTGKAKPSLAKTPNEITLFDIYQSIEGNTNLIQVDSKTNPDCVVGANIQAVLTSTYTRLQASVEAEMTQITLQQIIEQIAIAETRPENDAFVRPYLS